MNMQANETTEPQLTRRQIAARKRAAEMKKANAAAKAWLATRKGSQTPVADKLIAKWVADDYSSEVGLRKVLRGCVIGLRWCNDKWEWGYITAEKVAEALVEERFSTGPRRSLMNAVALMQEANVPALYWQEAAAELAAQKQAKSAKPRRCKPVQLTLTLTETEEPATAEVISLSTHKKVSTLKASDNKELAAKTPQKVVTYEKPVSTTIDSAKAETNISLKEAWKAYCAADRAFRAMLRQRNDRLRAISKEKGMMSPAAHQAKGAVIAEYEAPLADCAAQLKRATGVLARVGDPRYANAKDDLAQTETPENSSRSAPQIEEAKAENVTAFKRKPRVPKPASPHPWRRALLQSKAA